MKFAISAGFRAGETKFFPHLTATCLALLFSDLLLAGTPFRDCPECPMMVVVPGGSFQMGDAASDDDLESDARPSHTVNIGRQFAIGVYEITRTEFESFVKATEFAPKAECNIYETESWFVKDDADWQHPGYKQSGNEPVVCITWLDTRAYVEWLSSVSGHQYRLPSEAEWEYLAAIGSTSDKGDPISHDYANYGAEVCCGPAMKGRDQWEYTAPVGSFDADAFGLYDIRGNVWEWLGDCYHDSYENAPSDGRARESDCSNPESRVVRGGGWGDAAIYLRSTYRLRAPDNNAYFTLGFRVARDLELAN
jgi:formylglycine-generating enzyme required for sulfatase activity